MNVIHCSFERHGAAALAIFNDAILHTTAVYYYEPRQMADMEVLFNTRQAAGNPVFGVEDDSGQLLGFSSYGSFRPWPAYQHTMEIMVYVAEHARGRGVGKVLVEALVEHAKAQGVHVLVAAVDSANEGSIAFHQRFGFELAGTIRECGYKFGRWLDLAFLQCILETSAKSGEPGH